MSHLLLFDPITINGSAVKDQETIDPVAAFGLISADELTYWQAWIEIFRARSSLANGSQIDHNDSV